METAKKSILDQMTNQHVHYVASSLITGSRKTKQGIGLVNDDIDKKQWIRQFQAIAIDAVATAG